ncbi:MAG: NAD(P)(+) transhydrogenase (Re/Si-specific) subunit beta [Candidatus Cyclonatronum sp.]|uniref:NAD(P)(+) transhydrogenase (Re/Si-specific) subunit beta n=1 Tax=Cyclonatronum sp. TaxID=3024185 RepID=UPI0025BBED31|nr:NAD(P)(+) transhydrogenase (Re/Si-specific) subunit beta [Cyclonatronum sp.]MCH8487671.1 NAD(P)(+) transhydrogenase (Re/Si-specific) subunit beta [Cyclonatronum sp.]
METFIPESWYSFLPNFVELAYLAAIVLFILGLKRLSSPATARSGNQLASLGMFLGVIVTLLDREIIAFEYILAGVIVGSLLGAAAAKKVEMTKMPELVAVFNGFGGIASALVALGAWFRVTEAALPAADLLIMGLSVLIGAVTFTGSLVAFAKLNGLIKGNAILFPFQNALNQVLLLVALFGIGWLLAQPLEVAPVLLISGISIVLGVLFVIRIGGADMPVVISLLNSLSGIAASFAGFVIDNNLLIVSGALVGAAGLILTDIMCKSMNRKLTSVLFAKFGGSGTAGAGADTGDKSIREVQSTDVAVMTAYAKRVVVVPGYGLAVAQAQHVIREVADLLQKKGVDVRYGIHPVAGRMPGHMNVLLAEANVPYSQLFDMEEINDEFFRTDVVLVIGANDVVNPQAKTNPGSPIYGMPILNVDEAKQVVVFKRSMNTGYAGIENDLFYNENTYMYFGDAKGTLEDLVRSIKEL